MKEYYAIEIKHTGSEQWHNWGKIYTSFGVVAEAIKAIRKDNSRLVEQGSEWRIIALVKVGTIIEEKDDFWRGAN